MHSLRQHLDRLESLREDLQEQVAKKTLVYHQLERELKREQEELGQFQEYIIQLQKRGKYLQINPTNNENASNLQRENRFLRIELNCLTKRHLDIDRDNQILSSSTASRQPRQLQQRQPDVSSASLNSLKVLKCSLNQTKRDFDSLSLELKSISQSIESEKLQSKLLNAKLNETLGHENGTWVDIDQLISSTNDLKRLYEQKQVVSLLHGLDCSNLPKSKRKKSSEIILSLTSIREILSLITQGSQLRSKTYQQESQVFLQKLVMALLETLKVKNQLIMLEQKKRMSLGRRLEKYHHLMPDFIRDDVKNLKHGGEQDDDEGVVQVGFENVATGAGTSRISLS